MIYNLLKFPDLENKGKMKKQTRKMSRKSSFNILFFSNKCQGKYLQKQLSLRKQLFCKQLS